MESEINQEMMKFMRKADGFFPEPGLTKLEAFKKTPAPSFLRYFESVQDKEQKRFRRSENYFMLSGIAVGLDSDGVAWPYLPGQNLQWLGFNNGLSENGVDVKTRGSVTLMPDNLVAGDHGKPVYCLGPNSFTMKKVEGAAEIGAIRHIDGNRAAVAFRSEGDTRPLNLHV